MGKWTWEEILDGAGPWTQPGEFRRPKVELEAVKADRRYYEEKYRSIEEQRRYEDTRLALKPERQHQYFFEGGNTRRFAESGRRPDSSCLPGGAWNWSGTLLCIDAHGVSSALF